MVIENVGILCGITSRTKAYLQRMIAMDLLPNYALIMHPEELMPGQRGNIEKSSKRGSNYENLNIYYDENMDILDFLKRRKVEYRIVNTDDVNDSQIINCISERREGVFIYSGFGGVILGKEILNLGKKFLHIHPGRIPDYKGSTTIYYSIINEKECHASAIFLTEKIDSGPLIKSKTFKLPESGESIDYQYDPYIRSELLVEVLEDYIQNDGFKTVEAKKEGESYHIIHPVLKHIAILTSNYLTHQA